MTSLARAGPKIYPVRNVSLVTFFNSLAKQPWRAFVLFTSTLVLHLMCVTGGGDL